MWAGIFNFIKDAPFITIAGFAGIFFVLLSFAESLPWSISIKPEQRKSALWVGLLLIVGAAAPSLLLQFKSQSATSAPTQSAEPPEEQVSKVPVVEQKAPHPGQSSEISKPPEIEAQPPRQHTNDTMDDAKTVEIGSGVHVQHDSNNERRYFKITGDTLPKKISVDVILRNTDAMFGSKQSTINVQILDKNENIIFCDGNTKKSRINFNQGEAKCNFLTKLTTYFILVTQETGFMSFDNPAEYDIYIN